MANHLFSQIPAQVLNKVNIYKFRDSDDDGPKKKQVKFSIDKNSTRPKLINDDSSTDVESDVNIEDSSDEPTSSPQQAIREQEPPKQYSDAKVQTEIKYKSVMTQTDESLTTRPLSDDDVHRGNMQTFSTIRPLPRNRPNSRLPPLRIGLSSRGKKRKVFYPNEENDSQADGA